jgi:hypothetical protein
MMMTPRLRKFALTTHVTSSVGWLGAVAAFLALAIGGLASENTHLVRAAYLAMHLTTWYVIVPLSMAAPVTGLVQSLGTTWGLFRHYWIVMKLLLTVFATLILLLHTQPIERVAEAAAQMDLAAADLRQVRIQLVGDASAALFVLFVTTMLSVYKPWGLTPYGIRKQYEVTPSWRPASHRRPAPSGRHVLLAIVAFVVLLVLLHLLGVRVHSH